MNNQNPNTIHLTITVAQNRNVLSRCLQIFSRRGFTLTNLTTEVLDNDETILHCSLHGPSDWHDALPQLLHKLIDVKKVEKVEMA